MSKKKVESKKRFKENLIEKAEFITKDSKTKSYQTNGLSKRKRSLVKNVILQNLKKTTKKMIGYPTTQCNLRSKNIKNGLKKGKWSIQENILLKEWIKKHGPTQWEQCGKYIKGRNGKQCREHWYNCLNPELLKGEWTTEEDFLIMYFYEKCNYSWKKLVLLFNGRTENSIKNRFFSELRKIATKNSVEKIPCSKIKLEELKEYLNEAIFKSKKAFLNEHPMNKEEFNEFLNKMKLKIKDTKCEEIENNEFNKNISNLEDIEQSVTTLLNNENEENNENNDNIFIGKKRCSTDEISVNSTQNGNEENKQQKIDNNEEIINNYNNNLDLKMDFPNDYMILNDFSTNEIKENNNEIKFCNNDDNLISNEDKTKIQSKMEIIDSNPIGTFKGIFESIDYQYKLLENCGLYRTDSTGNLMIVENCPFNCYNGKNVDNTEGIKELYEENIAFFGNK